MQFGFTYSEIPEKRERGRSVEKHERGKSRGLRRGTISNKVKAITIKN